MYRSYFRYVSPKPRTKQPTETYTVEQVWGAAAYANRINGGYCKDGVMKDINGEMVQITRPNRDVMRDALSNADLITDADRQQGMAARTFLSQNITMKGLRGQALTDFDKTVGSACERDEFTNQDRLHLAVIASQIRAYQQTVQHQQAMERVDRNAAPLGAVGAKITADVEVVKSVYSLKYNTCFVTGITSANQAVFFSFRTNLDIGSRVRIRGTVKALRPDATQLNRVKVIGNE
jgi:hypothetical protein